MSTTLDLGSLPSKVNKYKQILQNTKDYRSEWNDLQKQIVDTLNYIVEETGLKANVEVKDNIENLSSVVLDLGRSSSGLTEKLEDSGVRRTMVKSNGALMYQQLFNGKVMVMTVNPYIEGYGEPKPPHMQEILKPSDLKPDYILRHVESLILSISEWEDYDDGDKKKESFNPIGFQNKIITEE